MSAAKTRIVYDGDDTEKRFPRTLAEATKNTYTSGPIDSPPEPMHRNDRIVLWASAVAAVSLAAILFVWG